MGYRQKKYLKFNKKLKLQLRGKLNIWITVLRKKKFQKNFVTFKIGEIGIKSTKIRKVQTTWRNLVDWSWNITYLTFLHKKYKNHFKGMEKFQKR